MDVVKTKLESTIPRPLRQHSQKLSQRKPPLNHGEQERSKRYDDAPAGLASAEVELTEVELEIRTLPEQIRDTEKAIESERKKLASKKNMTPSCSKFVVR